MKAKTFAIWGLAFKPETDDIREAPALVIINELLAAGAQVKAFDPEAMPNVESKLGDKIEFAPDMYSALKNTDALIICTEWSIFRTPDFDKIKQHLNYNVIFDGRNLYDSKDVLENQIEYFSIGRP